MQSLLFRQRSWLILASACTVLLTAGCGGNAESLDTTQQPLLHSVQYDVSGTAQAAQANPNSFTLKPAREFNGFNPELWNDHKSWTECDCGRQPQRQQAKVMTWNPV